VAWNVVDWEITRTSRIAVTQYMYAVEWPILNLTLWPSGLDDSGTEEGNVMCREPNQQSRVFAFAWDVESSRQSRWAGVVAFMFRTRCFQFRRELTTRSHLSVLGEGLLLAPTPDLRPPPRKS
jgi:hypothetical protein